MDEPNPIALSGPADPRLYFDSRLERPERFLVAGGEAVVFSARCPTKETPNEDAAAIVPIDAQTAALIVADGMGGMPAGEQASALAVESMRQAIAAAAADPGLLRSAIIDGFERAHEAVRALGVGAATTLAVVEIQAEAARPYHVGDSTILVVGQRGRTKLQTLSHSPVAYAVEAGLLDESEAMHHEDRHMVTNVIGIEGMRIDVGLPLALSVRDTVLLASDGLLDNLEPAEIIEHVRKGPLLTAAARLVDHARQRMNAPAPNHPSKPDDLTFLLFRRSLHPGSGLV